IRSDVLPVFARSTSVLSAKAYTRPTTLNQPVILNGDHNPTIVINPNDIIVGDLDGVVCIPSGLLDEVIKLCKKYVVMDENVRQELLKGSSIVEAFSLHRPPDVNSKNISTTTMPPPPLSVGSSRSASSASNCHPVRVRYVDVMNQIPPSN
ncbi:4502_t:CDS:2, partial [Entrophospora sp. SA101]